MSLILTTFVTLNIYWYIVKTFFFWYYVGLPIQCCFNVTKFTSNSEILLFWCRRLNDFIVLLKQWCARARKLIFAQIMNPCEERFVNFDIINTARNSIFTILHARFLYAKEELWNFFGNWTELFKYLCRGIVMRFNVFLMCCLN